MLKYKIDILESLKEKGYTSYKIRKEKLIGESQLQKIRTGEIASKETLNTICKLLYTQIECMYIDFMHKKALDFSV